MWPESRRGWAKGTVFAAEGTAREGPEARNKKPTLLGPRVRRAMG